MIFDTPEPGTNEDRIFATTANFEAAVADALVNDPNNSLRMMLYLTTDLTVPNHYARFRGEDIISLPDERPELIIDFTVSIDVKPGDTDGDGDVDADDATLAANWLRDDVDVVWADGDFNSDFKVNDIDATLLATNWNPPASTVPEPATPVLIAIALAFLSLVRISRRK